MNAPSPNKPNAKLPWRTIWTSVYSLVLIAASAYLALTLTGQEQLAAFIVLGILLAALPITLLLAAPGAGDSNETTELRNLVRAINTMVQESGLSEGAKRIIHRREEREILRRAIEQDLTDKDCLT